jgi:23S rRNA pseudouridine1911/1915/1917 synthase
MDRTDVPRRAPRFAVGPAEAGVRLDKFLSAPERLGSRGRAVAALERRKVFINGDEASRDEAGRRLAAADVVSIWMDRPGSAKRTSGRRPGGLDVVYEDEAIIVVNKPAGMLAVPLERREQAVSVYDEIERHLRARGKTKPLVVHRIDRDTSGLVLFAKSARAQAMLKRQFLRHEPERVYLAVVYGRPSPASGTWRDHLAWDQKALVQKAAHVRDPRAKEAIASYRVVESFAGASLVEVRLVTGKRNQIRLQARLRGHTLVGEARYTYGPPSLRPIAFPRQALHAARLAFQHPDRPERLALEAPLPADLADLLTRLRAGRA